MSLLEEILRRVARDPASAVVRSALAGERGFPRGRNLLAAVRAQRAGRPA